ncbi:MAG: glutathione S-transferase family protein [Candidatus Eremiobacterota bacterium]
MKLYSFPPSPNHRKVAATAMHLGLNLDFEMTDLSKGDQQKPEFLAMNPNGMIPTLKDGDFCMWESNAIMVYLCSKVPGNTLYPADPTVQADILRWMFWQAAHWGRACGILLYENFVKRMFTGMDPDGAKVAEGTEMFHRYAKVLNDHLAGREWLVGSKPTLADFSVGCFLMYKDAAGFPMADYPVISAWYSRLEQLDAWKKTAPQMPAGAGA